ncbi:MAG: hypothetical protein WBG43_09265 [Marinifilaceae bacterium]
MRLFMLSILLFITSTISAQEKEWTLHKSEECKISFKMPNNVQRLKKENNNIKSDIFQTKDLTCTYGIVASYFDKQNFSRQPIDGLYKEMKKGSLLEDSSILLSEQSCVYQKMLVKEIKYSALFKKMEYIYYKRFFFKGPFIYQISIGGAGRHSRELEANKEIFFNSITFL